jgi:type IV pilus assembly protein PilE
MTPIIAGRFRGFTLIELMIVVMIVAFLSAIAFPAYQEQQRKGKRAEGKAKLVTVAQRLERRYTDSGTYQCTPAASCGSTDDIAPLFGLAAGTALSSAADSTAATALSNYSISPSLQASSYTLTATNQFNDAKCGNLTLTSTGVKGMTGGTESVAYCW